MSKELLFTNRELPSYEDYKEWCKSDCAMEDSEIPAEDSEDFAIWKDEETSIYWEDFDCLIREYDKRYRKGNGFIVDGTLGLWDGKRDIHPTLFNTLKQAVQKCIGECELCEVQYDTESKVLEITAIHHDGTNTFTISEVNYGIDCVGFSDLEKIPMGLLDVE